MRLARTVVLLAAALAATPALALELDPFWGWGRPLADATDAVNAKVTYEVEQALDEANAGRWQGKSCEDVERRVMRRFRYPIFQKMETWAMNARMVDRSPANAEEDARYRKESMFAKTYPLDVIRWMPPSPSVSVNGVRIGTDKFGHFFSQGITLHRRRRHLLRHGDGDDDAARRAVKLGILSERTVLGMSSSGVLSRGDLEANYQGMRFYDSLCGGDDPYLEKSAEGWRLRRPIDFREYVTPEWDESWQTSIYAKRRWKRVKPVLVRYCPLLSDPEFQAQRAAYEARAGHTLSEELVEDLVRQGKLPPPENFSLEKVCAEAGARLDSK